MDAIERLTALFEKFPGIGPRQAQRFVQFLLRSSPTTRRELAELLDTLGRAVSQCAECMRYHSGKGKTCSICSSEKRDPHYLAVVASDADLSALERSGIYNGRYFVLGGTISLVSEKTNGLRIEPLLKLVSARTKEGLSEVILALPANPEGDATAIRVREELVSAVPDVSITSLGRGLSTGSELEYADPETIKSALESRK